MSKSATVFARVEPNIKEQSEAILNNLGLSMSNAIDMYLRQIVMNKGIPFEADIQESINLNYDQLERLYREAQENYPVSEKLLDKFAELDDFVIAKFKLAFGNRILKQLKIFIPTYVACGGTDLDGLDFIFTNKILKKFESLNIAFLRDELKQLNTKLDTLFGKGSFKMAHKYIDNLIKMAQ